MEQTSSCAVSNQSIIPTVSSYRDINDFLFKHQIQKDSDKEKTNTRIPDQKTGIHGGAYHIPDSEYSTFLKLYYRDIIKTKKKEYLTEKHLDENGPILVDLDFRHEYEVDERQYTKDHIDDLIGGYLEEIKNMYELDEDTKFPIYIFEKPTVNRIESENKTKDGIHAIIGIQADHITQQLLRQKMLVRAQEMWSDFPKTNTWEDVFDIRISKGTSNWQLYGSRKPNYDRYILTHVYNVEYNEESEDLEYNEIPINTFNLEENFEKLSARYSKHLSLIMKNQFITRYEEFKESSRNTYINTNQNQNQNQFRQIETIPNIFQNLVLDVSAIARISNKDELTYALNQFLDSVSDNHLEYDLKATYEIVNILPPSYYEIGGTYDKWIRVGWALKNTNLKLLIVWIAFSAKAKNFQYSSIRDLCDQWNSWDFRKQGGLTKLSLIHWAKTDAKDAYEIIRRKTIDYYIEQTIKNCSTKKNNDKTGCGDFDLANVLHQLYKGEYVCVSVKANVWYQYKDNRWVEIDSGTTLRKAISVQLRELYNQKSHGFMRTITTEDGGEEQQVLDEQVQPKKPEDSATARTIRILNICQRLSNTNDKKNIMTEAKELFYDPLFLEKLDTNPYLLCFKNGVIDFKEKIFRKGQPEDNISLSTGIDYIPLDPVKHKQTMDEINDFMNKLFPEKELCRYMWEHLASTLCGTTSNQTFNMYIGVGSNGKSALTELMSKVLGKYYGVVPTTLVTEKRGKVGGLTPEIVELKGLRYAVMQEPSKTDVINEGMMKQLTSGKDPLQGRAPYMPQTVSFIPQFKLVVACNALMGVKANDHGTWRRIRVVPFKALFTTNPVEGDKEKPYQYKLIENIDEKFDEWKEVFASMLVNIMFETNGIVKDCDIVLSKSNEYRQSQDYISEFVRDTIIRDANGRIKKNDLNNEFSAWYMANYGGRGPPPKDLHEYMDKEFGRQRNQIWHGVKINYQRNDDNDNDDDINDVHANDLV